MDALFEDVKNFLDITWDLDAGEQKKLSGIIERGKSYIEGKTGKSDFEKETQEKELLLNYCMYARAGQIDEFIRNYRSEIIALQVSGIRKNGENSAETKR